MTDSTDVSSAQLDRIAQLRARRGPSDQRGSTTDHATDASPTGPAGPTAGRRRARHAAPISRVVAAGLGATTMFGIVGLLGLNDASATNQAAEQPAIPPQAQSPAPAPIRVVVHRVSPALPVPRPPAASTTPVSGDVPEATVAARAESPVVLTAKPVVRTVTVTAPAPAPAPAAPAAQAPAAAPAPTPKATTRGSN